MKLTLAQIHAIALCPEDSHPEMDEIRVKAIALCRSFLESTGLEWYEKAASRHWDKALEKFSCSRELSFDWGTADYGGKHNIGEILTHVDWHERIGVFAVYCESMAHSEWSKMNRVSLRRIPLQTPASDLF